jgi:hypothetical protein
MIRALLAEVPAEPGVFLPKPELHPLEKHTQ